MTDTLIETSRPFWVAGIVAIIVCALYLELPRSVTGAFVAPEKSHADPQALSDFRKGLALIDSLAARTE